MRRITTLVVYALALTVCAGAAFAASTTYTDTMKVDYFINASASDTLGDVLQLTNTGYSGGNICADIFVYDPNEEIQECCSCLLTPNDLSTLSVNLNLLSNTLTGYVPATGSIRVVAAKTNASGYCPLPTTAITPVSYAIRTWSTHIQYGGVITETSGQDAPLGSAELGALQNDCFAIGLDGSGFGICTCGSGD